MQCSELLHALLGMNSRSNPHHDFCRQYASLFKDLNYFLFGEILGVRGNRDQTTRTMFLLSPAVGKI